MANITLQIGINVDPNTILQSLTTIDDLAQQNDHNRIKAHPFFIPAHIHQPGNGGL